MGDTKEQECVMKSSEGKFMTLEDTRDGPKLCVVEKQNNEPSVYIVTGHRENQMAFRFQLGDSKYVTMVTGNELKLEMSSDEKDLPDSYWFEKYDGKKAGEHYGLRSVAQPSQYLCIKNINLMHYIILSEDSDNCVLVTDKKKQ